MQRSLKQRCIQCMQYRYKAQVTGCAGTVKEDSHCKQGLLLWLQSDGYTSLDRVMCTQQLWGQEASGDHVCSSRCTPVGMHRL